MIKLYVLAVREDETLKFASSKRKWGSLIDAKFFATRIEAMQWFRINIHWLVKHSSYLNYEVHRISTSAICELNVKEML